MAIRVEAANLAGVSAVWIKNWAKRSAVAVGRPAVDLAIVFMSSKRIRRLNQAYRRRDQPTDILSFPAETKGDLGDIFIAPQAARAKAEARGEAYRDYLRLLIVHGVLHLAGFKHRTDRESRTMGRWEAKILKPKR